MMSRSWSVDPRPWSAVSRRPRRASASRRPVLSASWRIRSSPFKSAITWTSGASRPVSWLDLRSSSRGVLWVASHKGHPPQHACWTCTASGEGATRRTYILIVGRGLYFCSRYSFPIPLGDVGHLKPRDRAALRRLWTVDKLVHRSFVDRVKTDRQTIYRCLPRYICVYWRRLGHVSCRCIGVWQTWEACTTRLSASSDH